jgi:hypothetical protein
MGTWLSNGRNNLPLKVSKGNDGRASFARLHRRVACGNVSRVRVPLVEWANSAVLACKVSAGCPTLAYILLFNLWARILRSQLMRRAKLGYPGESPVTT